MKKTYSTFAKREHRAFGGFSMGSVTTWYTFIHCLDYFKFFLPMSGDCWTIAQRGDKDNANKTAAFLDELVKKSGYKATEFSVLSMCRKTA